MKRTALPVSFFWKIKSYFYEKKHYLKLYFRRTFLETWTVEEIITKDNRKYNVIRDKPHVIFLKKLYCYFTNKPYISREELSIYFLRVNPTFFSLSTVNVEPMKGPIGLAYIMKYHYQDPKKVLNETIHRARFNHR